MNTTATTNHLGIDTCGQTGVGFFSSEEPTHSWLFEWFEESAEHVWEVSQDYRPDPTTELAFSISVLIRTMTHVSQFTGFSTREFGAWLKTASRQAADAILARSMPRRQLSSGANLAWPRFTDLSQAETNAIHACAVPVWEPIALFTQEQRTVLFLSLDLETLSLLRPSPEEIAAAIDMSNTEFAEVSALLPMPAQAVAERLRIPKARVARNLEYVSAALREHMKGKEVMNQ